MQGALKSRVRRPLSPGLSGELTPRRLARGLSAGVLLYFLEIIVIISFAALIFSGRLAGHLPAGLSMLIVGEMVLCAVVAVLSSYAGSIATVQDTSCVMIAIVMAAIVAHLPAGSSAAQQFATATLLLVGTTVATGLCFLLLGIFKLGGLVRFLPYPVMGGFLAGTGWLLAAGGLGVMTDSPLTAAMFQPSHLPHWLPGAILGAAMLLATARVANPLVLPGLVVGSVVLFYAGAWLTGTPLSRLSAGGWLLGPFPASSQWQFPLDPAMVSQVNWSVLLEQAPGATPILVVSVISLLLNVGGLELLIKRDIDLNRELVITGLSNLGAGLVGSPVGFHALSVSGLNHTLSGGRRMPGLIACLLLGLTALVGTAALGNVPRLVVGALLVFLGLGFLFEWVYQAWFKFPRMDFLIVVLILAVIAFRGFLEGIIIGLVLTIVLFVVNYSRIDVVYHALSGLTFRSRVRRSRAQQEILDRYGDQLYILALHGYIFFGTANTLFEHFRARVGRDDRPRVRFAALDFARVTGLDSTALLSFSKMLQLAQDQGTTVVFTGLHGHVYEQFLNGGYGEQAATRIFPDLDRGVEWCESQLIAVQQVGNDEGKSLKEMLTALAPSSEAVDRLAGYLSRAELAAGERLITQGDAADAVFFIESGQVSAYLESPDHEPVRLETMRGGRVVGELAFYLHSTRTAAVVVDEQATVYSLSLAQLDRIERTDPDAAKAFHQIIARLLADRVVHLMRTVDALQN
jgi:SulP family sulfate permease